MSFIMNVNELFHNHSHFQAIIGVSIIIQQRSYFQEQKKNILNFVKLLWFGFQFTSNVPFDVKKYFAEYEQFFHSDSPEFYFMLLRKQL